MSKVHIFFFLFLLLPLKTLSHNQLSYYVNYVDPFIGSDNSRWTYFAPVSTPYGLIRMEPVTSGLGGYIGGGQPVGYNYNSTTIQDVTLIKSFQISGLLISPSCNNNKTNYFESYIAHHD